MSRPILFLFPALALFICGEVAQALTAEPNAAPVVTSPIASYQQYHQTTRVIDLTTSFTDPDASAAVKLTTSLGAMNFTLDGSAAPLTVANFLNYVNSGRYFITDTTTKQQASLFVHRAVSGFVIQSGGFLGTVKPDGTGNVQPSAVPTFPPVQNEPLISNTRGTIAMAKLGGDPNSATSQWFINLVDNSANLDAQNGGFTVFGRVTGTGMSVADAIAALPKVNAGSPFDSLPVRNYTSPNPIKVPNFVSIPEFTQIAPLRFTAASSDTNVATASISETRLLVGAVNPGTAQVTVTATDLDGAAVLQSFSVTVVAAPGRLVNVATRLQVGTNENVLIAGFIVKGGTSKRLLVRGIGPSSGVAGALANPVLELHDGNGALTSNDDWGSNSNKQEIIDTGIAPASPLESAILMTVPSSDTGVAYTAVLQGVNGGTGIGVVEAYDLDSGAASTILNVSTRGRVETGDGALFGGFIIGGSEAKRILVRGIGPSLTDSGVTGALANPTIELHDGNGAIIDANDDWQMSPQASDIQKSGIAPSNPKESAMLNLLPPSFYTAIIRGVNNTTGIGSVEVYQLP